MQRLKKALLVLCILVSQHVHAFGVYAHMDINWSIAENLGFDEGEAYWFALGALVCDIDKADNLGEILRPSARPSPYPVEPPASFHKTAFLNTALDRMQERAPTYVPLVLGMIAHAASDTLVDDQMRKLRGSPNNQLQEIAADQYRYDGSDVQSIMDKLLTRSTLHVFEREALPVLATAHREAFPEKSSDTDADYIKQWRAYIAMLMLYKGYADQAIDLLQATGRLRELNGGFYEQMANVTQDITETLTEKYTADKNFDSVLFSAPVETRILPYAEHTRDYANHSACAAAARPLSAGLSLAFMLCIAFLARRSRQASRD